MQTLKVFGQVDASHRLSAAVPSSIRPGRVEVVVIVPTESTDDAEADWSHGIVREWKDELSDPREDIYTLADGEPVDESL